MNFNYHISETQIKCPHCNKRCADNDHVVGQAIDDKIEFKCEHCGMVFWASMHYSFDTYSDCALNGHEHSFAASETHPTVFHCKNCCQYEARSNKALDSGTK